MYVQDSLGDLDRNVADDMSRAQRVADWFGSQYGNQPWFLGSFVDSDEQGAYAGVVVRTGYQFPSLPPMVSGIRVLIIAEAEATEILVEPDYWWGDLPWWGGGWWGGGGHDHHHHWHPHPGPHPPWHPGPPFPGGQGGAPPGGPLPLLLPPKLPGGNTFRHGLPPGQRPGQHAPMRVRPGGIQRVGGMGPRGGGMMMRHGGGGGFSPHGSSGQGRGR